MHSEHYHRLSLWINWLPQTTFLIDEADLPEEMKAALIEALTIHGDCLLDLLCDDVAERAKIEALATMTNDYALEHVMDSLDVRDEHRVPLRKRIYEMLMVYSARPH